MAKIILFLLLLTIRSNVYAISWHWYCVHDHGDNWYCYPYEEPTCSNTTEYQTISCPIHQSGGINQSRTYSCTTQTWSAWTTTSNNCTQDPPTCIESTETRQLACASGFEGLLIEQRSSICSDPYGSPTWTAWSTISNTCKMTVDNVNNVASPVSPISPLNPNSVINQQVTLAPIVVPESVTVQDMTAIATTPLTETVSTSVATVKSEVAGTTSALSPVTSTTTTSATVKAPETPKGKELVPGFGIVLSMQLLNSGYNLQQTQIEESIKLIQEQDYERQQNLFIEFISANDTGDYLIRASANRWRSILRHNPLQRFDLDD